MAQIPIIMPQLGESIAEATIVRFLKNVGDSVDADTDIIEVETNKAVMEVTAPASGILCGPLATEGESYPVGATLGSIDLGEESPDEEASSGSVPCAPSEMKPSTPGKPARPPQVKATVSGLPVPAHASGVSYLSPRMKARMAELGLHSADLAGVAGSGASGRVTIDDLERFLEDLERNEHSPASSMRVAVADAMRRSWTRPLATVVLPVRLDTTLAHRRSKAPHKAGLTLYALRAIAMALSEHPAPAGRLIGDRIIHPRSIDIGFAVEAEEGVLVPVIRNAEQHKLEDLIDRYDRLVDLARKRRLPAAETGGSIATVTNYGVFGLMLATPIPLPEQTLLLGIGAGRIAPHWDPAQKTFVPITEAFFTLSFDHRVLDGGAAGRLLKRIAELLHNPEQL